MRTITRKLTCHERGICQRTDTQCHRACHMVPAWQGEPPLGYEAAPASNVHQLHTPADHSAQAPTSPLQDDYSDITRPVAIGSACTLALLVVLGLIGWSISTDHSAAHTVWQWLQQIRWAGMRATS